MPLIGKLADKCKNKPLHLISSIGVIVVSFPFYYAVSSANKNLSIFFLVILLLLLCIQFALIPSIISELYPTSVRFTCIGFSFNVCDSVIGGLTPLFAILLVHLTKNPASFILLLPISAIIFLFTLRYINVEKSVPLQKDG